MPTASRLCQTLGVTNCHKAHPRSCTETASALNSFGGGSHHHLIILPTRRSNPLQVAIIRGSLQIVNAASLNHGPSRLKCRSGSFVRNTRWRGFGATGVCILRVYGDIPPMPVDNLAEIGGLKGKSRRPKHFQLKSQTLWIATIGIGSLAASEERSNNLPREPSTTLVIRG